MILKILFTILWCIIVPLLGINLILLLPPNPWIFYGLSFLTAIVVSLPVAIEYLKGN